MVMSNNPFPQDSELYFKVYEKPVYWGEQQTTSYKGLIKQESIHLLPVCMNVVSSTYQVFHNKELMQGIEANLINELSDKELEGVVIKDQLAFNGRDCVREYIFPNISFELDEQSIIAFRIIVTNSYGATSAKVYVAEAPV